jgi:2-dehydro-3-deoxygluconokinase
MPYDLVTFGEAMIRLTSPGHTRLEQTRTLEMSVGGAEWNVAVNVARLGLRTAWVSRLVDNWTGRLIAGESRRHGVDVSNIQWVPFDGVGRVRNGFYHLEVGVGPRASTVTYDRAYSAISLAKPEMLDWPKLLAGCRWLHVSGVTPALSEGLAATVIAAFESAGKLGVRTSYDLNYRGKLWKPDRAQAVAARILPHVRVLIGNEEDFDKCLGLSSGAGGGDYSQLDPEGYKQTARQVVQRWPNVKLVGTTLRNAKTGLLNDWRTLVYDGKDFHLSRVYEDLEVVDRVGGGDSFSAAMIFGLLGGQSPAAANDFAAAYSALAHTFPGDINWATADEANKALAGGSARISR